MDSAVVFGVSGFLGQHVQASLEAHAVRVIGVARSLPAGGSGIAADVTDPRALDPEYWNQTLAPGLAPPASPLAIINLVTCKFGDRSEAERVNVAAVTAMLAARTALAQRGPAPLTVHAGSVSEYRTGGKASAYAAGKRAAREACRAGGVDVILTMGPITGRSERTPASRSLRRWLRFLPGLRSAVRIGVSPVSEAAEAMAVLARSGSRLAGASPCGKPRELALAGQEISWGRYLGLPDRPPRWFPWEPPLWQAIASLEGASRAAVDRLGSLARIALDPAASHYRLTMDPPVQSPGVDGAEPLAAGWQIRHHDGGAGDYLVGPGQ